MALVQFGYQCRRYRSRGGSQRDTLGRPLGEAAMKYEAIVELLDYAGGHEQAVRITTTDAQQVVGIPTSVDTDPTALEVYLHPVGAPDTEIAVRLTHIQAVEMA
jgi:hypothetical protein